MEVPVLGHVCLGKGVLDFEDEKRELREPPNPSTALVQVLSGQFCARKCHTVCTGVQEEYKAVPASHDARSISLITWMGKETRKIYAQSLLVFVASPVARTGPRPQ